MDRANTNKLVLEVAEEKINDADDHRTNKNTKRIRAMSDVINEHSQEELGKSYASPRTTPDER